MKINLTISGMNVVTTTSLSVLLTRKSCLCTRRSHVTTTTTTRVDCPLLHPPQGTGVLLFTLAPFSQSRSFPSIALSVNDSSAFYPEHPPHLVRILPIRSILLVVYSCIHSQNYASKSR